jgi:hypothetical protein
MLSEPFPTPHTPLPLHPFLPHSAISHVLCLDVGDVMRLSLTNQPPNQPAQLVFVAGILSLVYLPCSGAEDG